MRRLIVHIWPYVLALLKMIAVLVLLVKAPAAWTDIGFQKARSIYWTSGISLMLLYASIFGLALLCFVVLPFVRNWWVRFAVVGALLVGYIADSIVLELSLSHLDNNSFKYLWSNRQLMGGIFQGYLATLTQCLIWIMPLGLLLVLPARRIVVSTKYVLLFPFSVFGIAAFLITSNGAIQEFPPPSALLAYAAVGVVGPPKDHNGSSKFPYPYPVQSSNIKKIVLIVDESVRGDFLEINGAGVANTPFLSGLPSLLNFGIAVSGANFSNGARAILRLGLKRNEITSYVGGQIATSTERMPSVWEYAKRAGLRTVMIDAWREKYAYMQESEQRLIDSYSPIISYPPYRRDEEVAQKLTHYLSDEIPSFIYVSKFGVHFPYQVSYPAEFRRFPGPDDYSSNLLRFLRPSFDYRKALAGSRPSEEERAALVNSYHNAVFWSVDRFFRNLVSYNSLQNAVILYTSDHGQSMWEGSYRLTHSSVGDVVPGEGLVPLFVLTDRKDIHAEFEKMLPFAFARASHFDVFPTLLDLMGYDTDWVKTRYGSSLLRFERADRREFMDIRTLWHAAP